MGWFRQLRFNWPVSTYPASALAKRGHRQTPPLPMGDAPSNLLNEMGRRSGRNSGGAAITPSLDKEGVLLQLPGLHFVAHPKRGRAAAGPGQRGVFLASVLRGDLTTFERRASPPPLPLLKPSLSSCFCRVRCGRQAWRLFFREFQQAFDQPINEFLRRVFLEQFVSFCFARYHTARGENVFNSKFISFFPSSNMSHHVVLRPKHFSSWRP